jgi:hypothetical protein
MKLHPAVVIHGLGDVRTALAPCKPVTLLSGRGAALYAGPLWWGELVRLAREAAPDVPIADLLDCADAPGLALGAIRAGQRGLVLSSDSPGFAAVAAIARAEKLTLLTDRPPALDLSRPGSNRRLLAWLCGSA